MVLKNLTLAALDDLLYRLESNIEQGDLAASHGAQAALDCFAHLPGIFDLFAIAVESFDDLRILRTWSDVQAGEILRFHRPAFRIVLRDTGLLRQITLVVKHDRQERQIMLLGSPVHCWRRIVVERSVTDHADHRTFGIGRFHAQRRRETSAQATDAACEKRAWLEPIEIAMNS